MARMSDEQRDSFLTRPRIASLATVGGGAPTVVPVWYEWDGSAARIFTTRDSPKVARILADPRVALSVAEPAGVAEAWVTIEGTAAIEERGGYALAARLAPRYYDAEKARRTLDEWRALADRWVVLVITPRRIRSLAPE